MSISKKVFSKVAKINADHFKELQNQIILESNTHKKIALAYKAIKFANSTSTTYYSSDVIENVFIKLAQENNIDLHKTQIKDSILHIATEVYATGGHTRVIERWIENALENETHSFILTKKAQQYIPNALKTAVLQRNGQILEISDNLTDIEKGLKLRKIASQYEKVVLHVHMNDVIPLIAFGTDKFKSPVFFFNHADHKFWLGVGISDCIVNFREFGERISKKLRGAKNNFILPLLQKEKKVITNKEIIELKKELQLPLDKKILFTSGTNNKYKQLLRYNFNSYIEKILQSRDDVFFLAIGATKNLKQTLRNFGSKRVKLLKNTPFPEFLQYLYCSDLVIDSFPMSGGVALLDAISQNKPILSLHCPTGQSDFIEKSTVYCASSEELVEKTHILLSNHDEIRKNICNVQELFKKENSKQLWQQKTKELYLKFDTHKVPSFISMHNKKHTDLDYFLLSNTLKTILKMPFGIDIAVYKIKNLGSSRYAIGIKLFSAFYIIRKINNV